MVKNTGGNKAKGYARKNSSGGPANAPLRISKDPNELYAQSIKNLGNRMFHVLCSDNKTRLLHIRGKFTGRGKRDNFVTSGTWLLVGLREFTSGGSDSKIEDCDLLEVYNEQDKERLRSSVKIDWSAFIANDQMNSNNGSASTEPDGFEFSNKNMDEYKALVSGAKALSLVEETEAEEEVNVDDI